MSEKRKRSIPEHMSFEPKVVAEDIAELERLASTGCLSDTGYGELHILKTYKDILQKEGKWNL